MYIARHKDAGHTDDIVKNWMRNRNTIELLGFWETMYNPILNPSNSTGLENKQD
ncbi:KilA-N domain-containing protein [Empedobacter brevis]|uniref:KilA-N domain-containing protein n=1 Tax=Empedobacter brevis TaxID=247 RepID=UPI001F20369B|nr:KilA-N domain-containing protein [Empedobacter brevis]